MADPAGATNYLPITSNAASLPASMPDVGNTWAADFVLNPSHPDWDASMGDFINGLGVETIIEGGVARDRPTDLRVGNPDFSVESAWGCKRIVQGASPELIIGFAAKSSYPLLSSAPVTFNLWRGCDLAGAPSVTSWENRAGVVPTADGFDGVLSFEESSWNGTSGEVKDWTSNARNATAINGASVGTGIIGNAAVLTRATNKHLLSVASYVPSEPRTVMLWIKKTFADTAEQFMFRHGSDAKVCVLGMGYYSGANRPRGFWGTLPTGVSSDADVTLDAWTHVALVRDTSNNQLRLYQNGTLRGTLATSVANTDSRPFYVGNYNGSSWGFTGLVDELCIASVARSANWITSYYNMTAANGTFWTVGAEEAVGGLGGPHIIVPRLQRVGPSMAGMRH